MNKHLQKTLVAGASLLMLAGVGAEASQAVTPIHASRISRLRSRRAKDHRDIKRINSELRRLEHKHGHKRHHERLSEWYAHNGRKLKWKHMKNKSFRKGWDDSYNNSVVVTMTPHYHNAQYKHGWLVGYAEQDQGISKESSYHKALHYYNNGIKYMKDHHLQNNNNSELIELDATEGVWNLKTAWYN